MCRALIYRARRNRKVREEGRQKWQEETRKENKITVECVAMGRGGG
jgi:hypothetical protein